MNVYTMIVAALMIIGITAVVIVSDLTKSRRRAKPQDDNRLEDLALRLDKIEKRLGNLESIVTSKDFDLNREFEELKKQA